MELYHPPSNAHYLTVLSLVPKMAEKFDESKAYVAQEEVYFDDGREIELLHFVYGRPNIDELRGSPEKVLAAIDEYGRATKYLMNVGEDKGKIVTNLIAEQKPKTMVSKTPVWLILLIPIDGNRSSSAAMLVIPPFCLEMPSARLEARSTTLWSATPNLAL